MRRAGLSYRIKTIKDRRRHIMNNKVKEYFARFVFIIILLVLLWLWSALNVLTK